MVVKPQRNLVADSTEDLLAEHFARNVFGAQGGLHRAHSTSDVYADRIGNHHALGGHYAADRHTLPAVQIRHERQMMEYEWKRGDVDNLLHGVGVHALGPNLHRHVVQFNLVHGVNVLNPSAKESTKCAPFLRTLRFFHYFCRKSTTCQYQRTP